MQTFAGPGEIDLSRYRHLTGALGETTELSGISRDRQNPCQYANDLKWPVRPPQASPHNTPRAPAPTPDAKHTKCAVAATSHTAIAALANRTRYYRHTSPARTFDKGRQTLGQLMIAIRSFHGVRNLFGAFVLPAAARGINGRTPEYRRQATPLLLLRRIAPRLVNHQRLEYLAAFSRFR